MRPYMRQQARYPRLFIRRRHNAPLLFHRDTNTEKVDARHRLTLFDQLLTQQAQ